MADIMDILMEYDGGTLPLLEKDPIQRKDDVNLDWISDEFLDSLMDSSVPLLDASIPLLDPFLATDNGSMDMFTLDCNSDSGLSYGPDCSPGRSIKTEDELCLNDALLETDLLMQEAEVVKPSEDQGSPASNNSYETSCFDSVNFVKEEEIECEIIFDSVYSVKSDTPSAGDESFVIRDMNSSDYDSNDDNSVNFSSGNSVSDFKEEPAEIVKRSSYRKKHRKNPNYSKVDRLHNKRRYSNALEDNVTVESGSTFPALTLTPEEQKLAAKECIKLPTHFPLTKMEERELKRIRRKIRNKVSAQDSRRRKKEYVDGLELRVKRTSEENADLMKRIKTLETQKMTLTAQVKKLQASLARCSGQTTPSSTCLLVFIMSLALILAPNLRNTPLSSENAEDEGISLSEEGQSAPSSPGRSSRNILVTQKNHEEQTNFSEEAKMLTEQLEKMQLPDSHVLSSVMEMLKLGKTDSLLKDHDYFRPRKRSASEMLGDGSWPPPKILAKMASELQNISTTFVMEKKGEQRTKEPVIIDLLSD